MLKDAQAKGYAEADPTGDIEGYDAANKAAIMATLGFHTSVTIDDVSVEGITKITADDIAAATAENKVIKLLAVVENTDAGVSARVYPALISNTHPLASVHGSFNAVFVKAEAADDLMFYGRGAGGAPTASAVVGDVVTEARHIAQGCTGPSIPLYKDLKKAPIEASKAEFAVRFVIHDNPGVLAAIAAEVRRPWRVHQRREPGSEADAEGSGLRRRTAAAASGHPHDRRAHPARNRQGRVRAGLRVRRAVDPARAELISDAIRAHDEAWHASHAKPPSWARIRYMGAVPPEI